MDMQGSRQLAVTQQQAWEALNDPGVLKVCVPGCESIEPAGDNAYALVNTIKVGPVAARFKSTIQLTDIQAPDSYTLNFDGNGGAAGFGKGTARVTLTPQEGGCELNYTVNATVGGKIAQVGQRLIDGVAKSMAQNFFKRFDEEMQRRYPEQSPAPAAADSGRAVSPEGTAVARRIPVWIWVVVALLVILGIAFESQ